MFSLNLTFQVLLMFDQRMYIQKKFELSSFQILLIIGWFSYFKTTAATGSKRFKLKPFVFSLGSFY